MPANFPTVYVTQQSGPDRPEYVTMSLLNSVQRDAKRVYESHKHRLPAVPRIPLVEATPVPATPLFAPQELTA